MKSIYAFQPPDKPEKCAMCKGSNYIGLYGKDIVLKLYADEFWLCEICARKEKAKIADYANKRNFDAFRTVMDDAELGHKVREALVAIVQAAKIS